MKRIIQKDSWLRKIRTLAVVGVVAVVGAGSAWGLTDKSGITISPNIPEAYGQRETVVYAVPGTPKQIEFQSIANDNKKIDGYVRWYVEDNENASIEGLAPLSSATNMIKYSNGYVWVRNANTVSVGPDTHCWAINYTLPSDKDEVVVVCEASSLNNYTENDTEFKSPMVTVVRRFIVRNASLRSSELTTKKGNLDTNFSSWRTDISKLAEEEENNFRGSSKNFIESYEIHTALSQGTNYRLGEMLSNYYIGTEEATDIRWSAFKANGSRMTSHIASELSNEQSSFDFDKKDHPSDKLYIWKHKFTENEGINPNATETQIIYITAEVTTDKISFYPVMFLKVYLEPFTEPLTQKELDDNYKDNANYSLRFYDYLARNQYQPIITVNFDNIDDENKPITWDELKENQANNFSTKPIQKEETAYAFSNPTQYAHRRSSRITAGQGEYALYRTLNYYGREDVNVSKDETPLELAGAPKYDEAWAPGYNKYMVDRLFDETKGTANEQYGFFFFLDATDEPGTVTKIPLTSDLCNNTQLVVSAWICDTKMGSGFDADLGIAFIGRKEADDPSTEVVLNRFYSGEITTKPPYDGDRGTYEQAQWQQIYYTFSIRGNVNDYEAYYIEILNNAPSTAGADYAVDDIRVYKSTPNIQVERENECDASSLVVGTDYATILRNMGWQEKEEVATDNNYYSELDYRKYRYGLMGTPEKPFYNSKVGNVYFAFMDKDRTKWMVVNKRVEDISEYASKSLRVAVPTELSEDAYEFYVHMADASEESKEKAKAAALVNEQIMNLRAIDDYNRDVEEWMKQYPDDGHKKIDTEGIGTPGKDFNEVLYEEKLVELYGRLGIPRLRCPWYDATNKYLYLALIDVENTDLKYKGQGGDTNAGTYWVITFSALEVAGDGDENEGLDGIDVKSDCALMSQFTIDPATTVLIDSKYPGDPDIAVCLGTIHEIKVDLVFYDKETGNQVEGDGVEYIFDWYYGDLDEDYVNEVYNVKEALESYRDAHNQTTQPISKEEMQAWIDDSQTSDDNKEKGRFLLELMNDNKLLLGTPGGENFDMPVTAPRMVAMPYIPDIIEAEEKYVFCTNETEVNLDVTTDVVPGMHQGFINVSYSNLGGTDAALRLGWPNMAEGIIMPLPIYKVDNMAPTAQSLGLAGSDVDIYLDDTSVREPIGKARELHIEREGTDANFTLTTQSYLKFSLNANAKKYMQEGQSYTLLIPFVQYADDDKPLNKACDGILRLLVKVVPEYLTWKGGATDNWYDDDKWYQSTKKELHEGAVDNTDAHNGSDNPADAFSPLYFTNITILGTDTLSAENRELQLDNTIVKDESQEGTLSIDGNIKYDLAVAKADGTITPYYIYNVDEVYFKPGATLLNQHLLTYTKAHVEFTMKVGKDYWMASPLQDVYAGDMYAPVNGGKQYTPAFGEIKYDVTSENSRWNMPFYQKAWNKTVWYKDENNTEVEVPFVKSNWNIEYNDVWVPYTIGKGFYARVEERDAMVRLPKYDASYGYETKALSSPGRRTNAGQLAELNEADGFMALDLSTVDNDGNHFLVGNPYMAYLNMSEFLKANSSVLAEKYWTIDNGKVIVGTPDVVGTTGEWPNEQKIGYVAPMQAFFVESKDYNPGSGTTKADGEVTEAKKVTFNASMTVAAATAKGQETKSFSAVNPILTLTATSKQGQSRAAVVQKSDASNQYEADKDAVALLDSEIDAPMAYTVAGSYAAAVNAIHDYKNVPLGVYAKDGEEVELSIEGASQLVSPLYLYDAVTRSTTPIDGDSFTLNLTGSSHGRYFLTTDEGIKAEGDIRIYSPADGQLIIASTPSDRLKQVQVYDLNGRMVESRQNVGTATCQLYVPGGIYIVRVQSEQGEAQAKLKIK